MALTEAKNRPYHHGDLRRALLDAVLAQVRSGGPDAVNLRAAARTVGVSPAATFRHFADKRAVMTALATEGYAAMGARMAAEAGADTAMARFAAAAHAYLAWALENPALFRIMFRSDMLDETDRKLIDASARSRARLIVHVPAALPPGLDAADVRGRALLAWGAVHGVATLAIEGALADGPSRPRMPPPAELDRALGALRPVFEAPPPDQAQTSQPTSLPSGKIAESPTKRGT